MRYTKTPLLGSFLIDLVPFEDERGFFSRLACVQEFKNAGLDERLVQVNNSYNRYKGTLRGLHYQVSPCQETKIVRCIRGSIWDVIVDLREESATFGKWFGHTLTSENRTMMYVPKGFAHGYISLEDDSEIFYFTSEGYSKENERGICWDDQTLAIKWPIPPLHISEKDLRGRPFNQKK